MTPTRPHPYIKYKMYYHSLELHNNTACCFAKESPPQGNQSSMA